MVSTSKNRMSCYSLVAHIEVAPAKLENDSSSVNVDSMIANLFFNRSKYSAPKFEIKLIVFEPVLTELELFSHLPQ